MGAKKIIKLTDAISIKDDVCVKMMRFTDHAKKEMLNEEFGVIREEEILEVINNGEVIEQYLRDRPYPSCLVLGWTKQNRPLHVVYAEIREENTTVIITVYQPDPQKWVDYTRRKK